MTRGVSVDGALVSSALFHFASVFAEPPVAYILMGVGTLLLLTGLVVSLNEVSSR